MMNNYRSLNSFELIGNLGKDAEVAKAKNGREYVRFSVATTFSVKNAEGKYDRQVTWHDLTWFGSRAIKVAPMLTKGSMIRVTGSLGYTLAQEGKHKFTNLNVDSVDLLVPSERRAASSTASAPASAEADAQEDFPI